MNSCVKEWFGERFYELHPLLQQLHVNGGYLVGNVVVQYPIGLSGIVGRRIATKMGIPVTGELHAFSVAIIHKDDGLHWDRCFNKESKMHSLFCPVGTINDGYWRESTGTVSFHLGVDIKDGGWYWRCKKIKYKGITLPLCFFPRVNAFKVIDDGQYKFYVGIIVPLLGEVLSYSGLLSLSEVQSPHTYQVSSKTCSHSSL